jgi:hypothetical protein
MQRPSWSRLLPAATLFVLLAVAAASAQQVPEEGAAPVTMERRINADREPQNWLTYHHDYPGIGIRR